MKKSIMISLIAMAALVLLPLSAMAQMNAISDSEMETIVGQDGITIDMTLDAYISLISYGDNDGVGTSAGYLNICQLSIPDTLTLSLTGLTVDVDGAGGATGRLVIGLPDITGGINIGAIRMGASSNSASGVSIGSVKISGLALSGSSISIYGHNNP